MSIALLFPAALAVLAALAVPILIHLARRSQQRTVAFAALRWIAMYQRPQRRPVLEEWPLLALRLLLLALLALFLSAPVLREAGGTHDRVLVVPGVDVSAARAAAGSTRAQWHWLAPGFPPVTDTVVGPVPVASLLREIDARLPGDASLTVFVPEVVRGLDGERVQLGRDVDWQVVDAAPRPARPGPPPRMALRHAPQRADAARYLRASVDAWRVRDARTTALDVAGSMSPPGPDVDALVWLQPGAIPDAVRGWVAEGRTLVLEDPVGTAVDAGTDEVPVWRDTDASILATASALGNGRLVRLHRRLQPDVLPQLLDPDFPDTLLTLLQPRPAPDAGHATSHPPLRSDTDADGPGLEARQQPLRAWLALLIALVLLAERLLASRSRRWTA